MHIKEGERLDDLQLKRLKIIQDKNGFCFGIDAVLLANFPSIKKDSIVVDLGTGTGIIPILLAGKSRAKKIYGIEIQDEVADMAKRSVILNNLEDRIQIINMDLKSITDKIDKNSVDVVTSNPPYMYSDGLINENDKKAISRHCIKCDVEDIIKVSSEILKSNGRLYMINRPNRLVDILYFGRKYKLEPKVIKFVHSKSGDAPKFVLIEFKRLAKPEVKILKPLYIYDDEGSYTDDIREIYSTQSLENNTVMSK